METITRFRAYNGIRPKRDEVRKGSKAQAGVHAYIATENGEINHVYDPEYRKMGCMEMVNQKWLVNVSFESQYLGNYSNFQGRYSTVPTHCAQCHYNQEGNPTGCFLLDQISDQLFIKQKANGIEINGQTYNRVNVHIGDAYGFTSLRYAEEGVANISIDPFVKDVGVYALTRLANQGQKFDFAQIPFPNSAEQFIGNLTEVIPELNQSYISNYSRLSQGGIYLVNSLVEGISMNSPFANLVTCYYPWIDMPHLDAARLAMRLLKQGGTYEVLTEDFTIIEPIWKLFPDSKAGSSSYLLEPLNNDSKARPLSVFDRGFDVKPTYMLRIPKNNESYEVLNPPKLNWRDKFAKYLMNFIVKEKLYITDVDNLNFTSRSAVNR